MCAKTTVAIDPSFTEDRMWLNGEEKRMDNVRLQNCLKESNDAKIIYDNMPS